MLVFFWGNWAEDHLFKEKGETANLAKAVDCRLLGFTPPSGVILEDMTPPWLRPVSLHCGQNFYVSLILPLGF